MVPLAFSSGLALVVVVILAALAFLWWLVRGELREEAAAGEQESPHDGEHGPGGPGA